jgi:hypothetical protein
MKQIASTFLPGSPEAMFWQWTVDNAHDIQGALATLGIAVKEGPDLFERLQAEVTAELLRRQRAGE